MQHRQHTLATPLCCQLHISIAGPGTLSLFGSLDRRRGGQESAGRSGVEGEETKGGLELPNWKAQVLYPVSFIPQIKRADLTYDSRGIWISRSFGWKRKRNEDDAISFKDTASIAIVSVMIPCSALVSNRLTLYFYLILYVLFPLDKNTGEENAFSLKFVICFGMNSTLNILTGLNRDLLQ